MCYHFYETDHGFRIGRMRSRELTFIRGKQGWQLLIFFIWAWDWFMPESLSESFQRALDDPKTRPFVLFGWAWVSSHLLFRKPKRILIWW